jgi:transposase
MAAPKKYPDELRERAVRLTLEARKDPATAVGAIKRVADQLGIHPEALRGWVKRAEIDGGLQPGTTTAEAARIAELEREVRELRRANGILKSAAVFFAAESDRPSR